MRFISRVLFFCFCLLSLSFCNESKVQNFSEITDIKMRKQEFIKTILPLIEYTNKEILKEREFVFNFFDKFEKIGLEGVGSKELSKMNMIAKKYKIPSIDVENKELFAKRIATIPISLVIAQAAIESGWGTSRFFVNANNIFGEWTWSKDDAKGLVPEKRDEGKNHRIRIFETLQDSVNSYALNLNRNFAYKEFRNKRKEDGSEFNGLKAAETMTNYSEIKEEYVDLLKQVLKGNKLLKYDINEDKNT